MSSLLTRQQLLASGIIDTIEKALEEGATEAEASIAAGINPKSKKLARYRKIPEVLERFAIAKAKSKVNLVRAVNRIATKGSVVREVRENYETRPIDPNNPDGPKEQQLTSSTVTTKEIPPDGKVAIQLLKVSYPEEFGDVRRVDMKKIGSAQQVDLESAPTVMDNPKGVIDMFLNGDGQYVPDVDDLDDEEEVQELSNILAGEIDGWD